MKACAINAFGKANELHFTDVPLPILKPDELLIKMAASSVNPVDYKMRSGSHKLFLGAPFPIILGYDAAGTVEAVGEKVTRFTPGDKVYGRLTRKYGGALAEYAATKASAVAKIPSSLTTTEAAGIPLAALTAYQALKHKARLKPGNQVLIIGATGGVGHFALQIANVMGAVTTAICGKGHENILSLIQPHHIIIYSEKDYKKTNKKFDVIFDVAGKTNYPEIYHLLNKNGTYITTLPRLKLLVHKCVSLFRPGCVRTLLMAPRGEELELLGHWIDQGRLKVFIDEVFNWKDVQAAHKKAEEYHTEGKIVIKIQ